MKANFDRLPPPPRALPTSVVLNSLFGGTGVVGWLLLLFTTPFVFLMLLQADLTGFLVFRGELRQAQGVVTSVKDTRAKENRSTVWKVAYEFSADDGARRQAVSYVKGFEPQPGASVPVEYPVGRPETSRLVGGRRAPFGPGVLLILVFVAFAVALVGFGLTVGLKDARLLREGVVGKALFVDSSPTSMTVNRQPVMALRYSFTGPDGVAREFTHNTTTPGSLTDDKHELVLYLPDRPEVTRLVDALPGNVTADEQGVLLGSGWGYLVSMLLALLTVLSYAGCTFLRLRA